MDFSFSDNWEWFFALCGLLGIGLMAIVRAIFGKPKLEFEFCVVGREEMNQSLVCRLKNSPFRNWTMKILFVPRPRIDDISVRCEVIDRSLTMSPVGTPFLADMITIDGKVAKQLPLPASVLPIEFSIITFIRKGKSAWLQNVQVGDSSLANGVLYLIRVTALLGDKQIKSHLAGCIIKNKIILIQHLPESLLWNS